MELLVRAFPLWLPASIRKTSPHPCWPSPRTGDWTLEAEHVGLAEQSPGWESGDGWDVLGKQILGTSDPPVRTPAPVKSWKVCWKVCGSITGRQKVEGRQETGRGSTTGSG